MNFGKILLLDLVVSGVVLTVVLIEFLLGVLIFISGELSFMILILFLFVLIDVVFFAILMILKAFATIRIALVSSNIKNSFMESWKMISLNWKEFFKVALTQLVIALIETILLVALVAIVGIFGAIFIGMGSKGFALFLSVGLLGTILLFLVLLIRAFVNLWRMDILIWWVKIIGGEKSDEKKKSTSAKTITNKKAMAEKEKKKFAQNKEAEKVAVGAGA